MHVGLLEEAKADLLAAAKADPQNKDIRVQVGREGGRAGGREGEAAKADPQNKDIRVQVGREGGKGGDKKGGIERSCGTHHAFFVVLISFPRPLPPSLHPSLPPSLHQLQAVKDKLKAMAAKEKATFGG
jgi:hypothetical protein